MDPRRHIPSKPVHVTQLQFVIIDHTIRNSHVEKTDTPLKIDGGTLSASIQGDACTFEIFSNASLAMLTKLSNLKWHESMKNHSQP